MPLFHSAIYVNASSERLTTSSRGAEPSAPIEEHKSWAAGRRLFDKAEKLNEELPLIFAQYVELTFWAIARKIEIEGTTTNYSFSHLQRVTGHERKDLTLLNQGTRLSNTFIRSYALVQTPAFLRPREVDERRKGSADNELKPSKVTDGARAPMDTDAEPTADPDEYLLRADRLRALGQIPRPFGILQPIQVPGSVNVFNRDPRVRAWVLQRSGGNCELCGGAAPFVTTNGSPYLECHHVITLAKGGSDMPGNTVALCPNCHRMLHSGQDRDDSQKVLAGMLAKKEPAA